MEHMEPTFLQKDTRISGALAANPALLLMLEHFGARLPIQEKTFREVAEEQQISVNLFLSFARLYASQPLAAREFTFDDLKAIIGFLKNTHQYYMEEIYPDIRILIQKIAHGRTESGPSLVEKFFEEYFHEVKEHLHYEDEVVFPYVMRLLHQEKNRIPTTYSVADYQEHHDDIEEKLEDLRNLLIKYLPSNNDMGVRRSLLLKLFDLEHDLSIHSLIEEKIFIPLVARLEQTTSAQ